MSDRLAVRHFRADDFDDVARWRHQAFGAGTDVDDWLEAGYVAEVDGRPVAGMRARPMGQWFGGRPVPSAAISSVVVALPWRSRGVLGGMVRAVLADLAEKGVGLAVLFPTSVAPYRRAGFEIAGTRTRFTSPPPQARWPDGATARPFSRADGQAVEDCYRSFARRNDGLLDRDTRWWDARLLNPVDRGTGHGYVVVEDTGVTGYALWDQPRAPDAEFDFLHRVRCRDLAWTTPSSARALVALLGRAASAARSLSWFGPPWDPLVELFDDVLVPDWAHPWMLRMVDPAVAIRARGYPPHVRASFRVRIDDPHLRSTPRSLQVRVSDGSATAETVTDDGGATVGPGVLAAIYSGWLEPGSAAALGVVQTGEPGDLAALASAFGSTRSWIPELF